MTMVLDPDLPMPFSAESGGGTTQFMSPEISFPSKFGRKDSASTPEADIYAFGLAILQVCGRMQVWAVFLLCQVLTGDEPFRGLRETEMVFNVVEGKRPTKPKNASAIGFSDSLWSFIQRCWDGDMNVRPKVAEVVAHLEEAVANWDGLMPPCVQAEEEMSHPSELMHCAFEILAPLLCCPLSDHTGGIFESYASAVPESPVESRTTFERLIRSTHSTHDRISLVMSIFSDHDQVEMIGNLCGDDAQTFIDVIDEVSACAPHLWGMDQLTRTQTSVPCRLDVGRPRITAAQQVSAHSAQDMWPSSPASKITGDSALLRPTGDTTVSWWVCGHMEGPM